MLSVNDFNTYIAFCFRRHFGSVGDFIISGFIPRYHSIDHPKVSSCFLCRDMLCFTKRRKYEINYFYLCGWYNIDVIVLWSDVGCSKTG